MPSWHAVDLYAKQAPCRNALRFLCTSVTNVALHMDHEYAFAVWHWTATLAEQRWQKPSDVRGVLVNCALFYCSSAASSSAVRPNCMAAGCVPCGEGRHKRGESARVLPAQRAVQASGRGLRFPMEHRLRRYFEAGFYDSATSSESTRSVTRELLDAAILFDSNRSLHAVRQLLHSSHDCCISIVALGGSTACGKGLVGGGGGKYRFPTTPGVEAPKGIEQAWPAHLKHSLDNVTASCCPQGHSMRNLCRDAAGLDYVLTVFESRLAEQHRRKRADLILVDTAVNDVNVYWLQVSRLLNKARLTKTLSQTELFTEALVRRVASLTDPPALAFVETAWFEPVGGTGGIVGVEEGEEMIFGAWLSHRKVLEYYGVPAVHMPRALVRGGKPSTRNTSVPLSRAQLYVDGLHLSRDGHWVQALFVAAALLRHSSSDGHRHQGSYATLAPPRAALEQLAPLVTAPLTAYDFSQRAVAPASLRKLSQMEGWALRLAEKVNGTYTFSGPLEAIERTATQIDRGKLGLVASWGAGSADATFTATMHVRQALLRVGYLRSYNGQASVLAEVTINSSSPWEMAQRGARNARLSRMFNGTWNEPVSIFTTTSFDLRSIYCDQGEEELPPCLPPDGEQLLDVRFTLLPNDGAPGGGTFTFFSISSW